MTALAMAAATRRRVTALPLGGPAALVVLLVLVTIYFTTAQSGFNLYTYNTVLLAALGALALNLLMGVAGQVSIGNAAFLQVGAFGSAFLLRNSVPFPLDVVIAGLAGGVIGLLVGLPALRIRGIYLILATLAAFFIVSNVVDDYQTRTVGPAGFVTDSLFAGAGLDGQQIRWSWLLLAVVCAVLILMVALSRGRAGRAWRIVRDHEGIAGTLGVNVTAYKLLAFVLSSAVIGVQGALYFHFIGSVSTETFTLQVSIQYIAMVLIGGLDTTAGPLIGAAVVTILPIWAPHLVAAFAGDDKAAAYGPALSQILYGAFIVLIITTAPRGLAGWWSSGTAWLSRRRHQPPDTEVALSDRQSSDRQSSAAPGSA